MDKLKERAMRREVQRLQKAGKMPTLAEFTAAVVEVRKEFAVKIRRARREARRVSVTPVEALRIN